MKLCWILMRRNFDRNNGHVPSGPVPVGIFETYNAAFVAAGPEVRKRLTALNVTEENARGMGTRYFDDLDLACFLVIDAGLQKEDSQMVLDYLEKVRHIFGFDYQIVSCPFEG